MRKKKIFWGLMTVIFFGIAFASLLFYFKSGLEDNNADLYLESNADNSSQEADNHNINWDKLNRQNSDIYAWLYVPGTNIDYPVVQPANGEDDFFYLKRNIKKENSSAGSIYSEMQNAKDFSDPVTVLYGHNMADGSMFATLHKFEDSSFFKKHDSMYIYMPGRKLTYKIYSAYKYDNRHILNSFDFSKKKVLLDYFKYTENPLSTVVNTRNLKDYGLSLTKKSKVLTLSTCTSRMQGDTRYLVQGVLIQDERTEQ